MKLNLGCGPDYRQGFINIDIRSEIKNRRGETVYPDMIVDLTGRKGLLFSANSIKMILAQDILEHFGENAGKELVAAWAQMLEPNGILQIQVPDVEACIELARKGTWPWFTAIQRIYGGQDYEYNYHYWGYTPHTMKELLEKNGLRIISIESVGGDISVTAKKEL